MSLESWFRLCGYATLGLSCVALVFAESFFLPSLQMCLAPVLALLLLAWWAEGRWSLPVWGANVLAALIGGGGVAWLALHLADPESWLTRVPVQLALVPYMGPLLIAALLVKVFQPRRPGDFWRLQGLGLLQVGLGCVLAEGPAFGGLLAVYLASTLAVLALRYRLSGPAEPTVARQTISARWLLAFTCRWGLLVVALTLLLFLLTPRQDGSAWEPLEDLRPESDQPAHLRVGQSEEIDLNHTGTLEPDNEVALEVLASDADDQPKLDLPGDQRWRGAVFDSYEAGRWMAMPPRPFRRRPRQKELPDFGPGQCFLTFTVQPRQAGGLVLAEPIHFGPESARLPVVQVPGPSRGHPLFSEASGTVLPLAPFRRREYHYRQVLRAGADPRRVPAEGVQSGPYVERLIRQNLPGMQEWTFDLLRRLSVQPRYHLPDSVCVALAGPQHAFLIDRSEDWEAVARVLTDYLANSGEFGYSLQLTRKDLGMDPVMDFLVNLKQGHCERYAAALTLMLRSLGIPARLVKGFRGAEDQGGGRYVVRHRHAHAWVEALVPSREASPPFDWLTLDPTPAEPASSPVAFALAYWWQEGRRGVAQLWQSLIVEYNADQQADLWDRLNPDGHPSTLARLGFLLAAGSTALVALPFLRRLFLRRRLAARGRITSGPSTIVSSSCWRAAPRCGHAPDRRRGSSARRRDNFCGRGRAWPSWRTCPAVWSSCSTGCVSALAR